MDNELQRTRSRIDFAQGFFLGVIASVMVWIFSVTAVELLRLIGR